MSIVVATVNPYFAVMSGDKKGVGSKTIENIQKIFKLNEDLLIGFTGSYSVIQVLNEQGYLDISGDKKPREFASELFNTLGGDRIIDEKSTNILIVGRQSEKIGYCCVFNTSNHEMQIDRELTGLENINYVLPPDDTQKTHDDFTVDYKRRLKYFETHGGLDITNVASVQKAVIENTSKISKTVNNKIDKFFIDVKRPD